MASRWLSIYFPWLWKERNSSNKILVLILISGPKISNLRAPASMCHIFIWRFIFERWLPSDSTWRGTLPHWKLSMNLLWHSVSKTSWLFMTFHDFPWFFMIFQDFSKIFSATPLGKRLFHIRSVWIFYEGPRAIFPTCSQTCKWKWRRGLDWWLKVVKLFKRKRKILIIEILLADMQVEVELGEGSDWFYWKLSNKIIYGWMQHWVKQSSKVYRSFEIIDC